MLKYRNIAYIEKLLYN